VGGSDVQNSAGLKNSTPRNRLQKGGVKENAQCTVLDIKNGQFQKVKFKGREITMRTSGTSEKPDRSACQEKNVKKLRGSSN